MRKLFTLAMIFACMFTFAGCKDDDEKEEQEVKQETKTTYTIKVDAASGYSVSNVYIFEFNEYGTVIERKFFAKLSNDEIITLQANANTSRVEVYSVATIITTGTKHYYYNSFSYFDGIEYPLLKNNITEEEYNQGIEQ